MKLEEGIRQFHLEDAFPKRAPYFPKDTVIFVGGEERVIQSDGVFAEKIPVKRKRWHELSRYRALNPFSAYWDGEYYSYDKGVIFRALGKTVYMRRLPQDFAAHFGQE